jgi:hypothetical protein
LTEAQWPKPNFYGFSLLLAHASPLGPCSINLDTHLTGPI